MLFRSVASLSSVSKLPFKDSQDGISNTFTILPDALGKSIIALDDEMLTNCTCEQPDEVQLISDPNTNQIQNLVTLIDGYVEKGGHHLNVNVLNRDTLLDAMEHPDNYPQLTIRVSGYAVNFIKLTKEQQRDVIERTFHQSL